MAKTQRNWFNSSPVNKGYISLKQKKTREGRKEIKKVTELEFAGALTKEVPLGKISLKFMIQRPD